MKQISFAITFFANATATRLTLERMTLPALRERILKTSASAKARLPWLKLAKFGNKRSDKGSLRHNDNVIEISGVEVDYDGEVVTLDETVGILRIAHLRALVYASPSHTAAKPRWRILAPTSRELPPEERTKLVARTQWHPRRHSRAREFHAVAELLLRQRRQQCPAPCRHHRGRLHRSESRSGCQRGRERLQFRTHTKREARRRRRRGAESGGRGHTEQSRRLLCVEKFWNGNLQRDRGRRLRNLRRLQQAVDGRRIRRRRDEESLEPNRGVTAGPDRRRHDLLPGQ